MTSNKLGDYMLSDEFIRQANTTVEKAIHSLEDKGIAPAYCEPLNMPTPPANISSLIVKVAKGETGTLSGKHKTKTLKAA